MNFAHALVNMLLRNYGITHVFGVSGGAVLHLIDAVANTEGMRFICPQTEQAAGFAADAYARVRGIGCAMVTSGPGATNLVTPIATSFYDSIPVVYIAGAVTTQRMSGVLGVRQRGFQETPIEQICGPITKNSRLILNDSHNNGLFIIARMIDFALARRRGPVVISIPDDVQRMEVLRG